MATSGELCLATAEALGISFETTREHLRHIRRAGMISFKGHGRGAATMTTLDASRLLIATAGSSFVKDSVETLEEFGSLQPIGSGKPMRGSLTEVLQPRIAFEKYLAEMMQRLIDEKEQLSSAYRRPPQDPEPIGSIALRLMSVVSASSKNFPRLAIARRFARTGGVSAVSFASPRWSPPVSNITEYVLQLRGVGLVQTRDVPAWTLAEIAHALVKPT
jgi:hypothetical protein